MNRDERSKELVRRIFNRFTRIYIESFRGHNTHELKRFWWLEKKTPELQDCFLRDFHSYLLFIKRNVTSKQEELLIKTTLTDLEKYVKNGEDRAIYKFSIPSEPDRFSKWPPFIKSFEEIFFAYQHHYHPRLVYSPKPTEPLDHNCALVSYRFEFFRKSFKELLKNGKTTVNGTIPNLFKYQEIKNESEFVQYILNERHLYPFWEKKIHDFEFSEPAKNKIFQTIKSKTLT